MYESDNIIIVNNDEKNSTVLRLNHLIANAAHDMRSPIGILNAYLEYIPSLSEQDRSLMRTAICHINTIVDTLLNEIKMQPK